MMLNAAATGSAWGVMAILLPLIGALLCFLWPRRSVPLGLLSAALVVACVSGLSWQVIAHGAQRYAVGGWGAPLGIDLYVDGLSLLMLMDIGLPFGAMSDTGVPG